jgi:hypothetical protein
MAKTFRELDEAKVPVTSAELIETVKDYVEIRGGIIPRVVIDIIRKVPLLESERKEIRELAIKATRTQSNQRTIQDYQQVADFLG